MRQLPAMTLLAIVVTSAWVLVPGMDVFTQDPVAQEEAPRFSLVARKVLTPKCALHY